MENAETRFKELRRRFAADFREASDDDMVLCKALGTIVCWVPYLVVAWLRAEWSVLKNAYVAFAEETDSDEKLSEATKKSRKSRAQTAPARSSETS